jgi:hypothetical protein
VCACRDRNDGTAWQGRQASALPGTLTGSKVLFWCGRKPWVAFDQEVPHLSKCMPLSGGRCLVGDPRCDLNELDGLSGLNAISGGRGNLICVGCDRPQDGEV